MITTIRLPLNAGRAATCMAAHIAAPLLIPAMMPSWAASCRPVSNASSSSTWITSSISAVSRFFGMKPAPMPWIRCLPGWPPLITGEFFGSTAIALKSGFLRLMYRATPVIVPPVPTPATMASMSPPESSQISGPVVHSWIAGLAGFSNCCGIQALGSCSTISRRLVDGALHALGGRGQHQVRAQRPQQGPPLDRHRLGHRQRQLVSLGRTDERQGDARVAAGRLDDVRVRLDQAVPFARFDHRHADAVLDAVQRIEKLALGEDGRLIRGNQPVDPNHRRVANRLGRIVVGFSAWHGVGSVGGSKASG